MGTDYTTNLGPYVECRTGKVEKTLTKNACINKKCDTYGKERSTPFCEKCGGKIDEFTYKTQGSKVDAWEVAEKLNEKLTSPMGDYIRQWEKKNNIDLWVSNIRRKGKNRPFSFDPTEAVEALEITPALMADEISEFTDQFRGEISILRKEYGLENVTVKWGLINTIY
jgi:hypothetical protein